MEEGCTVVCPQKPSDDGDGSLNKEYDRVYPTHTPGAVFQSSIARQPRGCQHRTICSSESSRRDASNRRPFWHRHRHYSNCGDIDHCPGGCDTSTMAQGGVIHAVVRFSTIRHRLIAEPASPTQSHQRLQGEKKKQKRAKKSKFDGVIYTMPTHKCRK